MIQFLRQIWEFVRPYQVRFFLGLLCGTLFSLVQGLLIASVSLVPSLVFEPHQSKMHLHERLDVVRMAGQLSMSPRNFTRVFHKQTGFSPAKYVEKLRIESARKYLEDTDISLERIAERCGLGGLVSMRRVFLRNLKTTPSDYRHAFRTSMVNGSTSTVMVGVRG